MYLDDWQALVALSPSTTVVTLSICQISLMNDCLYLEFISCIFPWFIHLQEKLEQHVHVRRLSQDGVALF